MKIVIFLTFFLSAFFLIFAKQAYAQVKHWEVQSIDTVKLSRDAARAKAADTSFDETINRQVKLIAGTGATHVALGTPYDSEFLPYLERWVTAARENDLAVWFRGNFSGWEGWFDYKRISREDHTRMLEEFLTQNKHLFRDGDIFTACPECENGGPGDPRITDDIEGHRSFLISEYKLTKKIFSETGLEVASNYNSMNGDVAKIVMDRDTTGQMDGVVVIDHYVKTPEQLASDIDSLADSSGGKIVLGEFGAPIPDIHGYLSEEDQAEWLYQALAALSWNKNLLGVNYWTGIDSSTALWTASLDPRDAQYVLQDYYTSHVLEGVVTDMKGKPIGQVEVSFMENTFLSNKDGRFYLPYIPVGGKISLEKAGYQDTDYTITGEEDISIKLEEKAPFYLNILRFFINIFRI